MVVRDKEGLFGQDAAKQTHTTTKLPKTRENKFDPHKHRNTTPNYAKMTFSSFRTHALSVDDDELGFMRLASLD